MNPFDYSLCNQTVTLYRRENGQVIRKVIFNAYFSGQIAVPTESFGKSKEKKFLLIIPGNREIRTGDRIYAGTGPKEVEWQNFVPALEPALFEASFAKPCFWEGRICHWEAGNRKETL